MVKHIKSHRSHPEYCYNVFLSAKRRCPQQRKCSQPWKPTEPDDLCRWWSNLGASAWCSCGWYLALLRLFLIYQAFLGGTVPWEDMEPLTPSSLIVCQPLITGTQNCRMLLMFTWPALIAWQNSLVRRGIFSSSHQACCTCAWTSHKTQWEYRQESMKHEMACIST